MRKILFTDIDGTLITTDGRITPRTLQAIRGWVDAGNLLVLSSSRSAPGIEPIVKDYDLKCCVSAIGGALLLDEARRVIYENGFDVELGMQVIEYITENQMELVWNIFTKDIWITADRSDPLIVKEEGVVRVCAREGSIDDLPNDAVIEKILCICAEGKTLGIEESLKKKFPMLSIAKSQDTFLEINNTGVSKAIAVRKACEHFGIDMADTIAFGDNYNDLDMLKAVAVGVAMGNAPEDIKAACDRVADDNDHDGLATVVEELLQ